MPDEAGQGFFLRNLPGALDPSRLQDLLERLRNPVRSIGLLE